MSYPALPTALNLRMIEDIKRESKEPVKEHVATYHTRTGLVALRIEKLTEFNGRITYSYQGKHGAGSGHPLPHVQSTVRIMLASHRGIRLAEGQDILKPA